MVLFLSFVCFAASLYLTASHLFTGWAYALFFPPFVGAATALTGVLIAALEYRARKTKKKRKRPMALIICNAAAGILAMAYWLYTLLILGNDLFS